VEEPTLDAPTDQKVRVDVRNKIVVPTMCPRRAVDGGSQPDRAGHAIGTELGTFPEFRCPVVQVERRAWDSNPRGRGYRPSGFQVRGVLTMRRRLYQHGCQRGCRDHGVFPPMRPRLRLALRARSIRLLTSSSSPSMQPA
jgi:hypothetical protein